VIVHFRPRDCLGPNQRETLAIDCSRRTDRYHQAAETLRSWRLEGATLYVTLEPCADVCWRPCAGTVPHVFMVPPIPRPEPWRRCSDCFRKSGSTIARKLWSGVWPARGRDSQRSLRKSEVAEETIVSSSVVRGWLFERLVPQPK